MGDGTQWALELCGLSKAFRGHLGIGRTAALVETVITWRGEHAASGTFNTLGVDSDQLAAAVIATEKMLNVVASRRGRRRPRGESAARP